MKLYTEEQVKQIQQAILCNHKDAIMDENYCLNVTTPIELPSDKEKEEEIQAAYQDGRESVIIEHTAALSTSNASSYSEGYKEGYNRAIELTKWTI